MVDYLLIALEILGMTSVAGLIVLCVTFIGFLPEIVIEGVTDQSRLFNSESKLKIRNNGRIAARNIRADVHELNVKFGTNTIQNCTFINCGPPIANKLSAGELTEATFSDLSKIFTYHRHRQSGFVNSFSLSCNVTASIFR